MLSMLIIKIAAPILFCGLFLAFIVLQFFGATLLFFELKNNNRDWMFVLLILFVLTIAVSMDFLFVGIILQKCGM